VSRSSVKPSISLDRYSRCDCDLFFLVGERSDVDARGDDECILEWMNKDHCHPCPIRRAVLNSGGDRDSHPRSRVTGGVPPASCERGVDSTHIATDRQKDNARLMRDYFTRFQNWNVPGRVM